MLGPEELVPSLQMSIIIFMVNMSIAAFIALYSDGYGTDIGNVSKGNKAAIIAVSIICAVAFYRNTEEEFLQAIHILKYSAKLKIR
jgi:hypothetical protein